MTRRVFRDAELVDEGDSLVHRLVVPRPIAWISTRSPDGVDNLAPHSFYTVASTHPPVLVFSTIGWKDTATHAVQTGEFVVNLSTEPNIEAVNLTGTRYPPDVSEFDAVGLTRTPSAIATPPSVAQSPASLECRVLRHVEVGNGVLVFGEVVAITVDDTVWGDRGPDAAKLRPVARLGGMDWTTLGSVSSRRRIPYSPDA